MGALHQGHLSLIRKCVAENKLSAVSVFVNPTQFNEKEDFNTYPRNLHKDLSLLEELSCDIVFAPSVAEIYPEKDHRRFDFGKLDKIMEGKHRPGHFNGVAQVVSKLFAIMEPDRAYFGEKDFQQLAIIRKLVTMLGLSIEIIACPIIREADGLAMSSRNKLLSSSEREAASLIPKTLIGAVEMDNKPSPAELRDHVIRLIETHPLLRVEYFEIVDSEDLTPVADWNHPNKLRACIAVRCGRVRLIDNMNISY
jgi:pantoate--beta-alanine ligase